jgi:hypothetical protein
MSDVHLDALREVLSNFLRTRALLKEICDVNQLSNCLQADFVLCFEKCLEGDETTSLFNIISRNVPS